MAGVAATRCSDRNLTFGRRTVWLSSGEARRGEAPPNVWLSVVICVPPVARATLVPALLLVVSAAAVAVVDAVAVAIVAAEAVSSEGRKR